MLCLRCGASKIQGQLHFFQVLDGAVDCLILRDIFIQRLHKTLGVLRCEDDPGLHLTLGCAWHNIYEINYKLRVGMRDDGEVSIGTFCNFF